MLSPGYNKSNPKIVYLQQVLEFDRIRILGIRVTALDIV
jgi:hypothetical protein